VLFGSAPVAWGQQQPVPPPSYFTVHTGFYDGDYRAALTGYTTAAQNGIVNGLTLQKWIDSICYLTMIGECNYQLGNYDPALVSYTAALNLYLANPNWLIQVQFPPVGVAPAKPNQLVLTPWHMPTRKALVGDYPTYVSIMQGQINNNAAVIQGGVVTPPVLMSIGAQEIVRCTCLAIRRRTELLGAVSPHDRIAKALEQRLSAKPAAPNHWSEAWVEVEAGLAYAAVGKDKQAAQALQRGELVMGMYDHALTGTALLELGRLSLKGGDLDAADRYFREATCSAAQFADYGVMEEAFRYGTITHIAAGRQTAYPPLPMAIAWAKRMGLRHLQTSLLVCAAENECLMGSPQTAVGELAQAGTTMVGSDMVLSKVGARFNFTNAMTTFQLGNVTGGEAALALALTFQTHGSLWLYHMHMVDKLWKEGVLQDRAATDLFQFVLREPTAADWASDPLESLSSQVDLHAQIFEHWFEATMKRGKSEIEKALEITDRLRKHRFLVTQEWGGRLLNLRWLLEGPEECIGPDGLIERQALLTKYPDYDALSKQARQLRDELAEMPLVPDDKDAAFRQKEKLAELVQVSLNQEKMLRAIGVRREACELVFPPLKTTQQVQESLPDGTALLVFFSTSKSQHYGFLLTNDRSRYKSWDVRLGKNFPKQVVSLLQGWGNFQMNNDLNADDLAKSAWKSQGRAVLEALTKEARTDLAGQFDELVIVPDGVLWYVPFEALQFSDGDEMKPLLSKVRIRYSPTVGLSVGDPRPRRPDGITGVVVGKLYPRDGAEVAEAEFEKLSRIVASTALKGPLPAPAAVFASLLNRLIVFNDVLPPQDGGPYAWAPLQTDRVAQGTALSQWFAFPWGGPEQVILPGFHTPAERALKNTSGAVGDDLFLSICGLMSTGARTVLISRWRPGGQTSYNLVREFVQELPHSTAAESWQRSVLLAESSEIEPDAEPRVKLKPKDATPKAENPFFWAGYLLADTGSTPDGVPVVKEKVAANEKPDKKPAMNPPVAGMPAGGRAPLAKGHMMPSKRGGKPAAGVGDETIDDRMAARDAAMDDDPDVVAPKPAKGGRKPAKMAGAGAMDDDDPEMDGQPAGVKGRPGRGTGKAHALTIDNDQEPGMMPPGVDKSKKGQTKSAKKAPKTQPVKRKKKPAKQPDGMDYSG
jgi:tetratricopeptide (TPR) repeat protein